MCIRDSYSTTITEKERDIQNQMFADSWLDTYLPFSTMGTDILFSASDLCAEDDRIFALGMNLANEYSAYETIRKEINTSLSKLKLQKKPEIICEPGRALVAESGSTVVKVILRKKQKLYINDGTYGSLFDGGSPNLVFPSRLISNGKVISKKFTAFDFYGPTCDSMDYMKGPFVLPNNVKEGDYIELGQLGGYGLTFRTQFNGFYSNEIYELEDKPIMSMYEGSTNKEFLVA